MRWDLSHCLFFWENCIECEDKWNPSCFLAQNSILLIDQKRYEGGEYCLCSSVFSVSVWSISSPMLWTNDFSTLSLWGKSRFCKVLQNTRSSSDGSRFSLLSVSLPPTLPYRSVGNCSQFSHLLPLEICNVSRAAGLAQRVLACTFHQTLLAVLLLIQEIPHNCHTVERPWKFLKYFQKIVKLWNILPCIVSVWKKGLPACALLWDDIRHQGKA